MLVRVLGVGPANVRILSRSLLMISLVVVVVVMVVRSVVALGRCNTAGTIIITPILTARTCCPVRVAPGLPAGLPLGPGPRAPPLALRPPAPHPGPALALPRPRPAGGGGPEPHLAAHAAVPRDEGAGDVHRAALARAEGGGAGAGAGRQVVEDAHMEIGMVGLEHVTRRLLMWRAVVREIPFFHRIQKWIKKWIIEWIMVSEEISEQIERI